MLTGVVMRRIFNSVMRLSNTLLIFSFVGSHSRSENIDKLGLGFGFLAGEYNEYNSQIFEKVQLLNGLEDVSIYTVNLNKPLLMNACNIVRNSRSFRGLYS